jgi:hypothetical protein
VRASHAARPLTVKPVVAGGALRTVDGQETGERVRMDPFGINVFTVIRD